jgi:hypothetical protein
MKRPLVPSTLPFLALLLAGSDTDAGVQWTQTTRTVGSEVIVTNATEFVLDSDSQSVSTGGLFVASTLADTTVTGVAGQSTSEQTSDLSATVFTGSGSFDTMTDVTDPEGFADVFGRSIFNGYFDVAVPTPFTLTGFVTNGGNGTSAQIFLNGPGGMIVNVQPTTGTTLPVDVADVLAPGSYLISVSMAGNAQESPPELMTTASGEWEVDFLLGGTTAVPVTTAAAGLRVFPNPARRSTTISLASRMETPTLVRVYDAAGRIVRSIDDVSGAATWDTRDAAGRPVPAGVYFITLRRDGRLDTGRVTVLR